MVAKRGYRNSIVMRDTNDNWGEVAEPVCFIDEESETTLINLINL